MRRSKTLLLKLRNVLQLEPLVSDYHRQATAKTFRGGRLQEQPAILISGLLLRMRRMFVASIRLDFSKNEWNTHNTI